MILLSVTGLFRTVLFRSLLHRARTDLPQPGNQPALFLRPRRRWRGRRPCDRSAVRGLSAIRPVGPRGPGAYRIAPGRGE